MRDLHVAAAGLGVNTIAMLIKATEMGIVFDAINFADPGKENPGTYEYIPIINKWLVEHGQPEINIVYQKNYKGDFVGLYNDCINQSMLPSIAYGHKSCSQKYKKSPQEVWANNWEPAQEVWKSGYKIIKYIGYDVDEDHRTNTNHSDKKYDYRYLLVELGMDRFDCIKTIIDAGLPLPPKSSCTFCPSMKPWEIIELYELHPKEFYDAIRMELNAMGNLLTVKGLGRDFSWWDIVLAYKYFKFVKKHNSMAPIPDRILKMVKKVNRSINNTKKGKPKKKKINTKSEIEKQAKKIVCDLFKSRIDMPCECTD